MLREISIPFALRSAQTKFSHQFIPFKKRLSHAAIFVSAPDFSSPASIPNQNQAAILSGKRCTWKEPDRRKGQSGLKFRGRKGYTGDIQG
jgi:hypothetical protein